jgi:predicted Fe-S protein YdhL (DUF1289 family)
MTLAVHDVPSPCIQVCRLDPATGLCTGCLRTMDEIAAWGDLTPAAKQQVLARLQERRLHAVPSA